MEYELGRVTAHPLRHACQKFMGVIRTWRYCRKHGVQTREWWGVYEKGTNNVVADFGNMPNAKERAAEFVANAHQGEGK